MKVVYIAHPIGGDVEGNLAEISKISRDINLNYHNILPFVPYYCDVVSLNDSNLEERNRGIKNNHYLLSSGVVDELWLYGPRISVGMEEEIHIARAMKIKILSKSPHILLEDIDKV